VNTEKGVLISWLPTFRLGTVVVGTIGPIPATREAFTMYNLPTMRMGTDKGWDITMDAETPATAPPPGFAVSALESIDIWHDFQPETFEVEDPLAFLLTNYQTLKILFIFDPSANRTAILVRKRIIGGVSILIGHQHAN
jgi:hypothetical protein